MWVRLGLRRIVDATTVLWNYGSYVATPDRPYRYPMSRCVSPPCCGLRQTPQLVRPVGTEVLSAYVLGQAPCAFWYGGLRSGKRLTAHFPSG